MFKLSEIKELIKLVDQTTIQELEIENEGSRLFIRKPGKTESVVVNAIPSHPVYSQATAPAAAPTAVPAAIEVAPAQPQIDQEAQHLHTIVSPMVGTFYEAASPGSPAFVKRGDRVQDKSVVCIIEAMKLMNEIEAEIKGEIVEVLVENGQLVEYGQPLFRVKPE